MIRKALILTIFMLFSGYIPAVTAAEVSKERLDKILAMTPLEMAKTGAWTTSAYNRLLGYINSIEDKEIRTLVLDMATTPKSTVFNATASPDAYRTTPATGGPGHHQYPGGLAVHALEVIEASMGWMKTIESVQGVRGTDRDLIIAQSVLHDWSKVWYTWDMSTGKVKKPEWFPKSWGGKKGISKWGWMGEHGLVVYSELLKRKAPLKVLIGAAAAHFDPQWDRDITDKDGKKQGLNAAIAEAAKVAGTDAPVLDKDQLRAEWFYASSTDGSWSFSHYVAGKNAHKWIRMVAKDLGIDPESPEASRLAWFVLSRFSDFKLYKVYQDNGFSVDAVKAKIISVLKDSSAYEVM